MSKHDIVAKITSEVDCIHWVVAAAADDDDSNSCINQ